MYCALPPSLQTVLELAKIGRYQDDDCSRFLDAFLKGLSTLGTTPAIVFGLRKHFQFVGALRESASAGGDSLEAILRQHDLLLGPDLGGFSNLFKSAIAEDEVFDDDEIDFEGLDPDLKARLGPMGDAVLELSALDDVCDVFSLRSERVAACIVLDALSVWIGAQSLFDWMQRREHLSDTLRLLGHRAHLEQITANFVQRELNEADIKDFSLWYLSRLLSGRLTIPPFERRLADTMLKKAELGSLATFENVGFQG